MMIESKLDFIILFLSCSLGLYFALILVGMRYVNARFKVIEKRFDGLEEQINLLTFSFREASQQESKIDKDCCLKFNNDCYSKKS